MKKIITFLFFICHLSTIYGQRSEYYEKLINEQAVEEKKYIISIRASGFLTFGSELWKDDSAFGADYKLGFSADFSTSSDIWLGFGADFLTRTYGYTYTSFTGRYISIPLSLSKRSDLFYAKTGLHFDFLISESTTFEDTEIDVDEFYNNFRMGLHFEVGCCKWKHFDIGTFIEWNFINFSNSDKTDEYLGDWNMGLTVAYKF